MSFTQAWLEDPKNNKIVLAECFLYDTVSAQEVSIYVSTGAFVTADSAISFMPIIVGDVTYAEKLPRSGAVSISYGDIALNNRNGELDAYLAPRYVWTNRAINLYFGDPSWSVANLTTLRSGTVFTLVFSGIMADVGVGSRDTLNIKLRNELEKLNTPVTDTKLGVYGVWPGGQQNQDQISPLVFGEVHNMSPVLIDPSTLEYKVNTGDTEQIIEVRDNGVPVAFTPNLPAGTFKLLYPSVGAITCSVQGVKKRVNLSTGAIENTYENNIAKIIATIVRDYGSNSANRLTAAELDLTQLNTFATTSENLYAIGLVITGRENILQVCQQVASSIGAQLYMTRKGQLRLLKYAVPEPGIASVAITPSDYTFNSLTIMERIPVAAATKIGYAKNWTVQNNLLTAIPQEHKELFAEEWLSVTVEDAAVKANYRLEADPLQKDTLLIVKSQALAEATRLNNLIKTQRTVFRFTGNARLLSLELGQAVTLYHPTRYNLSSSPAGQVVGLTPNWTKQIVEVEVLI